MEDFQLTLDWANRDIGSAIIGIILGIVIFFIGRWLARLISRLAARSMERAEVDPLVVQFAKLLIYVALLVSAVIAALDAAGIHTTSFMALLASAGLAIGLAVKDAFANFASGVMILLNKPYRKDDVVEAAGTGGTVEEVSIFNTVLQTSDNVQVIVPNAQVTNDTIKNYSANDTRRVDIVTGIGYDDHIGRARDTLMDIMTSQNSSWLIRRQRWMYWSWLIAASTWRYVAGPIPMTIGQYVVTFWKRSKRASTKQGSASPTRSRRSRFAPRMARALSEPLSPIWQGCWHVCLPR